VENKLGKLSEEDEFKQSVEMIREYYEERYESQSKHLTSWVKTANVGNLYMILFQLIFDTNESNKSLLQNDLRTIDLLDEIVSLQNRVSELEAVQEQQNHARIKKENELDEFIEIATGIKTMIKDRAQYFEKQKQNACD
jgi:hypothetical protein